MWLQAERLARALRRERLRFTQSYNDRLFGGLVVASLAAIVVFRFVLKVGALETAAWVAFAFLQVCLPSMRCAYLVCMHVAFHRVSTHHVAKSLSSPLHSL